MFGRTKVHDIELKETVDKAQFVKIMRQWLDALESNEEVELNIKGQECLIPANVANNAKLKVEYEISKGEYELELTMKWT
jgi:amphi-Trp domain-containing protein